MRDAIRWYRSDSLERDILEARLLTLATYDEIATWSQTTPTAVAAYEHLFFDFRRLLGTQLVSIRAIRLWNGDRPPSLGAVLRWIGYHGGPLALEAAIPVARRLAEGYVPHRRRKPITPEAKLEAIIEKFFDAWLTPDSRKFGEILNRQHLRLLKQEAARAKAEQKSKRDQSQPSQDESVRAFLDGFFNVSGP